MELIYGRSKAMGKVPNTFCPGCMHGTAWKLICEVAVELEIEDKLMIGASIGCSTYTSPEYVKFGKYNSAHGRSSAVGTGFKRCNPDTPLIVMQGDGDCAAIGTGETIHTALRGEAITVLMMNNQIYGMTGGQLAPTTLEGQVTTTTTKGRTPQLAGNPIKMAEIIATLDPPMYVARQSLHTPKNILAAKKSIKRGLELQITKGGYSFIELLTACPTNWKMNPEYTPEYIENVVTKTFPLGVFKSV